MSAEQHNAKCSKKGEWGQRWEEQRATKLAQRDARLEAAGVANESIPGAGGPWGTKGAENEFGAWGGAGAGAGGCARSSGAASMFATLSGVGVTMSFGEGFAAGVAGGIAAMPGIARAPGGSAVSGAMPW